MSRLRLSVSFALAAVLIPSAIFACLWDYDTLLQERSRFPDTLEIITGKFLRHSKEFYEWRIRNRLEKLVGYPDYLAWHDDLAVAYDKTGQHQKAIDTMLAKDRKQPGLYATEANLGTFYIHSGQLEKGLEHIDKALRLNPDAHFGREKYQKLFVEYVLASRKGNTLAGTQRDVPGSRKTFAAFLRNGQDLLVTEPESRSAIKGVLGMMRFGNYDSPVLLAALGSLLSEPGGEERPQQDAKRLAARAFLKASYGAADEADKKAYRASAQRVLRMQTRNPATSDPLPLEELEAAFRGELEEARAWYEELRRKELAWISDARDPEAEFAELYRQEPEVSHPAEEEGDMVRTLTERHVKVVAAVSVASMLVALLIVMQGNRRWAGEAANRWLLMGRGAGWLVFAAGAGILGYEAVQPAFTRIGGIASFEVVGSVVATGGLLAILGVILAYAFGRACRECKKPGSDNNAR